MPPISRVKQTVLRLYKDFLRLGRQKPGVRDLARREFRRQAGIPPTDVVRLEQQIRRARQLLATLSSSHVTGVSSFRKPANADPAAAGEGTAKCGQQAGLTGDGRGNT